MNANVLLVDDDVNLLRGLQRGLRKQFQIDVAVGAAEGLQALAGPVPYHVVVVDMRMPGMDGIGFLEQVRVRAPDAVRIMLTGNADLTTAIRAVNEGNVFRFVCKPCDLPQFASLLEAAVRQHQLITAERDLLEQTLQGAIRVCTEILSAVDATSYGQALKVRDLMRAVAERLGIADPWQLEVAALLARIGNAAVPPVVAVRHRHGAVLTGTERDMLARVPEIGHALLRNVPRLAGVADIVRYSAKHFDGSGPPADGEVGTAIPAGARALKIVTDFVALTETGESPLRAMETLRQRPGVHDPEMLAALADLLCPCPETVAATGEVTAVPVVGLCIGDLLVSNVETIHGVLLMQAGPLLTQTMLERIYNFARLNPIKEPISVVRRGRHAPVAEACAGNARPQP